MKRISRWAMVLTATLALVISAGAQEKPAAEKKAKKKAAEVAAEQKPAAEMAKPVAEVTKKAKKKAEAAVEEKKATVAEAAKTAPVAEKSGTAKAAAKMAAPYTGGVVNLNTATKAQLEALPGVGEANANHIIKGRPYKSAEEILTRKIVQERYYNAFKAHVTAK